MKILLLTYGTEGDTRPLAALGRALMERGHDARLLADVSTLGTAALAGVPAEPLAGDIRASLGSWLAAADAAGAKPRVHDTVKALAQLANAHARQWMGQAMERGRGCDAIVLSGLASFVGLSVAEALGIPAIGAGLIPITPTRDFASPFLPPRLVPGWLNKASHRFVNQMIWKAFRQATNDARAAVCRLPPRKALWAEHPMVYGVSPSLLPRPGDWPANALVCGQWVLPSGPWSPPPELRGFLDAGEPPVYVGFGSMTGFDAKRLLPQLAAAIGGRRALFFAGWSGVDSASLPGSFFPVGETPHDWLFPRTSMVIHHGGSGTTHSAASAGVPSVVIPFAGDQVFWADRLARAGVAGAPLHGKRLNERALAEAITFAERPEVRARSSELGRRMSAENGVATAALAIEKIVGA